MVVRVTVKEKVQEAIWHLRDGILFMRREASTDVTMREPNEASGVKEDAVYTALISTGQP